MKGHPLRGEGLKRESSSGRNSPMYVDERSRDSFRDERYGRDMETDDGRYHERLHGSSRFLSVREDSRHGERRGSREQNVAHERGGHRDLKHAMRSSSRGHGGEREGGFSLLRDDRRGSLRVPRQPHEHIERSQSSRPDFSSHRSRDRSREVDRNLQREHHHKVREERKERQHRGHRHRNRREAVEEEKNVASVETITISSESGEGEGLEEVRSRDGRGEKIEELIRDLESGSSSGEISEEESEREEDTIKEREGEREHSSSEKDKSSDGMFPKYVFPQLVYMYVSKEISNEYF